jgi:hypothetical protein
MMYVLLFQKTIINLMMKLIFLKKNYNKIFMTIGDKENKLYYDSYQELKTDVEWLCEHVY